MPYHAEVRRAMRGTLSALQCFGRDLYGKWEVREPQASEHLTNEVYRYKKIRQELK